MSIKLPGNITKQTLFRHIAAWLAITIYYILYSTIEGSTLVKTVWIFLLILNYSFAYYTLVLFIWPKIISEKKSIYSILILFSIVLFCSFFYFQLTIITPWLGGVHPMIYWPFNEFINNALKLFSYVLFTSIGTYYNWIGIKKIKEDLKADKDIIEMEFLFLKNQFHSHLTFNFLNFCYNKIRKLSPTTTSSIEDFSDMLRYSLIKSSDGPVLLETEIEYIENYIATLKFISPNINMHINCTGNPKHAYIFPRLLGGLVEQFFRNFSVYSIEDSTLIFIDSTPDEIIFRIKCTSLKKIIFMTNEELQTTEQILQSFYNNKYSLLILNNNGVSCELKLENVNRNHHISSLTNL